MMPEQHQLLRVIGGALPVEGDAFVRAIESSLVIEPPTALARATSLWAWKLLWEATHGKGRGGDRKSRSFRTQNQNEKISFCSAAAEKLSATERTIQLDVKLAEDLGPQDIKSLWPTRHADNAAALRTVAKLEPALRSRLIAVIKDKPDLPFARALVDARLRVAVDSEEQAFQQFAGMWAPASSKLKRRILDHIGVTEGNAAVIVERWRKQKSKAA
jgi:hypothetical protein